LNINDTMH